MSTPYHARYFAHELTRHHRGSGVGTALFNASVKLNPHQVDAALFAIRNPLSAGVVLADEVGLGKTIAAGLVLCQMWAERRRRLLVVCPASLRKQWSLELKEKFNLPNIVIDTQVNESLEQRHAIVIISFEYASSRADELRGLPFDLVVIDEAHKLRNVYRANAGRAQNIKAAFEGRRKVLMTATPFQNSLMELYGITTILSSDIFGDVDSFRSQYGQRTADLEQLHNRIMPFFKRTLRKNVLEYINYRARQSMTFRFCPGDDEQKLYEAVSAFLMRDDLIAIPKRGRSLIEMMTWKLLASSPVAVAQTLEKMRDRLLRRKTADSTGETWDNEFFDDSDLQQPYQEEMDRDRVADVRKSLSADQLSPEQRRKLDGEIVELGRYIEWARGIRIDAKARKLLEALTTGLTQMQTTGAAKKALVFTESRRTQEYLKSFLEANGYAGNVVLFNGSNSGPDVKVIVDQWIESNRATGRTSGSQMIDSRTALVEHFRDSAVVMIATEAAAEGINLQFCSLVINYDLPWNPQRIEQRIGRCHRYGQEHDVVVINFLNEKNRADSRVLELLGEKFQLFEGVFGASDEVLGSIEDGIDFEKRIHEIYRRCRTPEEIDDAFRMLQEELKPQIEQGLKAARQKVLDHFDADVHSRLKSLEENEKANLDRIQQMFWSLSRFQLAKNASFNDEDYEFDLHTSPLNDVMRGHYALISKERGNTAGEFLYRMSHPLGEWALETGRQVSAPSAHVRFQLSSFKRRLSVVEELSGQCGWIILQLLIVESFDREELLLFSGVTDSGRSMDQEVCEKLFFCDGRVVELESPSPDVVSRLEKEAEQHVAAAVAKSLESGHLFFQEECERIDRWARDKESVAEMGLKETKKSIDHIHRQMRKAATMDEQFSLQEELQKLERQKKRQRQELEDTEDEITRQREEYVAKLRRRLTRNQSIVTQFIIRWEIH
ncbi:MAG: SNF2-related protein [Planctomyces sp.]